MIIGILFGVLICGVFFVAVIAHSGGLDPAPAFTVLMIIVSAFGLIGAFIEWLCK
ncbi:hypothetical protein [Novosphingobium sp. FSW06-99]|uniref:hypothetical protein n=1 Tax=Novosphingobium sp. FSW06-99 TaxID=1739113 RepID=UPI000AE872FF|nr:hypothetical protein [Novosphingobium sp. FSW06-99]